MKKLLFIPLMFIASVCFSQDTVKIPIHAAKLIIKDLVDYESVKLQLHLCKEELDLTNKKCQAKDTIITNYKYKVENCESRISIEKEKIELYKNETSRLKKEYRKLKIKNTLNQIGSVAIMTTMAYFLITK